MSDDPQESNGHRRAGQFLFAVGFTAIAILLVALLGDQTVWKAKVKFFAQPRFWPAVGVIGMAVFGALHLKTLHRNRISRYDLREARIWFESVEYALWFLVYVWVVPIVGYLPTTLIFAPLLTWRLGYRSRKMLWISVVFSLFVVVLFKSMLQVKIPGGLIYEYLPAGLRSLFILNF